MINNVQKQMMLMWEKRRTEGRKFCEEDRNFCEYERNF